MGVELRDALANCRLRLVDVPGVCHDEDGNSRARHEALRPWRADRDDSGGGVPTGELLLGHVGRCPARLRGVGWVCLSASATMGPVSSASTAASSTRREPTDSSCGIELKLDVVAISTVALQALRRGPAN